MPASVYKPLFYMVYFFCPISKQAKQDLDFQGSSGHLTKLSTKLSTENLGNSVMHFEINNLPKFPPK